MSPRGKNVKNEPLIDPLTVYMLLSSQVSAEGIRQQRMKRADGQSFCLKVPLVVGGELPDDGANCHLARASPE